MPWQREDRIYPRLPLGVTIAAVRRHQGCSPCWLARRLGHLGSEHRQRQHLPCRRHPSLHHPLSASDSLDQSPTPSSRVSSRFQIRHLRLVIEILRGPVAYMRNGCRWPSLLAFVSESCDSPKLLKSLDSAFEIKSWYRK
jgi:hypothetical protein